MNVELVPHTEAEIAHLCSKVTPEIRAFCASNMNWAEWPEIWLRDTMRKDPSDSFVDVEPISVAQWWEFINERVVTPGEPSSSTTQ